MAGLQSADETPLASLRAEPAAFIGKTVRTRVRVAEVARSPQGVFLWAVPAGAPIDAAGQRLLFPPGSGGEELLEMRGRDLVLVMQVENVISTLQMYETAVVAKPISHLSLFGLESDGGAEAAALRERLEREADAIPGEPSLR